MISVTPKFSNGVLNDFITVSVPQPVEGGGIINKDFIFYYEKTTDQNGLELVIPIKKHEKKECFRAIEEQLMYIPNIVFNHKIQNEFDFNQINIAAKVLYRDTHIVISETTLLNYPHILLGAGTGLINYGAIDFEALELEPKKGAVGLILDINDVEVTPSREAVVWSTKTRQAIIKSYNEIVETATKLINKELDAADDYWDWIQKVGSIKSALVTNQASTGSVLQKLSGIIDASSINKIYYRRNGLDKLYTSDIKDIIGEKLLVRIFKYDRWNKKTTREKIKSVNTVSGYNSYVTDGASDKYKDRYLYEQIERKEFIVIKRLDGWNLEKTSNLIGNSKKLIDYDSIIVPDNFMNLYIKEEMDGGKVEDEESVSVVIDPNRLAKIRKLEEKILFHRSMVGSNEITYSSNEVKVSDIMTSYTGITVLYGSFSSRNLINSVIGLFPYKIFSKVNMYNVPYNVNSVESIEMYESVLANKNISTVDAILISKENEKYLLDINNFQNISNFIIESYKNKKLVFNSILRFVLTFSIISKIISKYNICSFNKELLTSDEVSKFYTSEFLNIIIINEIFKSSPIKHISAFFSNAISYEMGKNNLDDNTLRDYLKAVDNNLPEELCEIIDEIEDIHIVDVKLINKTEEYCKFYSKYNSILKKVNYGSDIDIIQTLHMLASNYEEYPKEIEYFR